MATGRIGVTPTLGTRWSKAPAGGTTSLSGLDDNSVALVYSVGYEQVYRNGVLLSRGNDYTATSGNSITLTDATIAGDIIEVFANELVPLTDAISKGQFTAKGALLSATAASTPGVLAVGTNGQYLTANSSTSTGLEWTTLSAGAYTELASGTLSGNTVSLTSISQNYRELRLYISSPRNANGRNYSIRYNNSSTSSDYQIKWSNSTSNAWDTQAFGSYSNFNEFAGTQSSANSNYFAMRITDYTDTATMKDASVSTRRIDQFRVGWFFFQGVGAISSIQIICSDGENFTGGSYTLWGIK